MMMGITNEMTLEFDGRTCNEGFARVAVAAFVTQLNPTLEEVADIKTAVSEAITNAIIHGYEYEVKKIRIKCAVENKNEIAKNKIQYFAFVVDYQVQFEPKEPTHRAFATACKSFKDPVDKNTLVTAYTQRRAIHKTYPRTLSKQHLLDKSRHLQQHLLFKFNKTVVRDSFGKQMFAMLTDVVQVVMFETTESTRVEMYEYDNNLYIAHTIRLTTVALAIGW